MILHVLKLPKLLAQDFLVYLVPLLFFASVNVRNDSFVKHIYFSINVYRMRLHFIMCDFTGQTSG